MTTPRHGLRLTLLVPELLAPLRRWGQSLGLHPVVPSLSRLLSRADREGGSVGVESTLCAVFGVLSESSGEIPAGPVTYRMDAGTAPQGPCLRADPVFLEAGIDQLVLEDVGVLGQEEARSLVETLNLHFSDSGWYLDAPVAQRWYWHLRDDIDLVTPPTVEVLGRAIGPEAFGGKEAVRWHGILNEIQMVLHDHPVNLERERRGLRPVNSLWPWGGGKLPSSPSSPRDVHFAAVGSGDPFVQALAQFAGIPGYPPGRDAGEWLEGVSDDGEQLLVLDVLRRPALTDDPGLWEAELQSMETHWFAPLMQALRGGRLQSLKLWSADGQAFTVTRAQLRWRFWRRDRALSAWTGERHG